MDLMKTTRTYYFSVEGETEEWYLRRVSDLINESKRATCKVSFNHHKQKDLVTHAKSITITKDTDI